MRHGREASPVSSTTPADVSSHEVSMPRTIIVVGSRLWAVGGRRKPGSSLPTAHCRLPTYELRQRFVERRAGDATLGDDRGDVLGGRHVERRIPDAGAFGREAIRPDVRHLAIASFLDRNLRAVWSVEIDRGQ